MLLDKNSYFSVEANKEYMSVSQFKEFKSCERRAMAALEEEFQEDKPAFLEGHLFETILAGDLDLFYMQHPEMVSSKGATKGELKANYKTVVASANRIQREQFLRDIIDKCEKQVILTGEIEGVKVKCCLDLFDKENQKIYDLKCMANFNEQWNKELKAYVPWYIYYGYDLQMAVYREIVRQNFGIVCDTHLIAATKEAIPDIQALKFDSFILKNALNEFCANVKRYDDIKKGLIEPEACGSCSYCKEHKKILEFEEVK